MNKRLQIKTRQEKKRQCFEELKCMGNNCKMKNVNENDDNTVIRTKK